MREGGTQGAAKLTIRPGEARDFAPICALEARAFGDDGLGARAVRRFLDAPHRPIFAARAGELLIGHIVVTLPARARAARVYSLAVDPDWRGRGVGGELLRAAEGYARARGREALRLEARCDNAAALALYRKLGFTPFARCADYYADGAEALRLEKALNPRPREDGRARRR